MGLEVYRSYLSPSFPVHPVNCVSTGGSDVGGLVADRRQAVRSEAGESPEGLESLREQIDAIDPPTVSDITSWLRRSSSSV